MSEVPRILIELRSNEWQNEFGPKDLDMDPAGLTAEAVIRALKESPSKTCAANDLDLLDEDTWSIHVQVGGPDGWTRDSW